MTYANDFHLIVNVSVLLIAVDMAYQYVLIFVFMGTPKTHVLLFFIFMVTSE